MADARVRSGFTFVEIMFSLMLLGIGLIVVAAVLVVATTQTQATAEATQAAILARNVQAQVELLGGRAIEVLDASAGQARLTLPLLHATDLSIAAVAQSSDPRRLPPRALAAVAPAVYPRLSPPGSYLARGKLLAMGDTRLFNATDPRHPIAAEQLRQAAPMLSADGRFACIVLFRRDRVYVAPPGSAGGIAIDEPGVAFADSDITQMILWIVQSRITTNFDERDLPSPNAADGAVVFNLHPRPVAVRIVPETFLSASGSADSFVAQFFSVRLLAGNNPRGGYPAGAAFDRWLDECPRALSDGSYFVISDDRIVRDPATDPQSAAAAGMFNGRVFRVGSRRDDLGPDVWTLHPGYDFAPLPGPNGVFDDANSAVQDDLISVGVSCRNTVATIAGQRCASNIRVDGAPDAAPSDFSQGAVALIVGRSVRDRRADLSQPTSVAIFEGPSMDAGVFTTFIRAR